MRRTRNAARSMLVDGNTKCRRDNGNGAGDYVSKSKRASQKMLEVKVGGVNIVEVAEEVCWRSCVGTIRMQQSQAREGSTRGLVLLCAVGGLHAGSTVGWCAPCNCQKTWSIECNRIQIRCRACNADEALWQATSFAKVRVSRCFAHVCLPQSAHGRPVHSRHFTHGFLEDVAGQGRLRTK